MLGRRPPPVFMQYSNSFTDRSNRSSELRLQLVSDLHLDTHDHAGNLLTQGLRRHPLADLVVIAGDVGNGIASLGRLRQLFGPGPIVMVAGNHDLCGLWWHNGIEQLKEEAKKYDIVLLENEAWEFGGVRFLGCTLWTDMELYGARYLDQMVTQIPRCLPEYSRIPVATDLTCCGIMPLESISQHIQGNEARDAVEWLSPINVIRRHRMSRRWLKEQLKHSCPAPVVVITHHLPLARSLSPVFKNMLSCGGFASNCDELFELPCSPAYWFHGHTHHSVRYRHQATEVICNPLGYPTAKSMDNTSGEKYEFENVLFEPLVLIDVEAAQAAS